MDVLEASNLATGFLRAVELPIISCNGMIQDVRGDEIVAVFESEPDNAVHAGLAMLRSLREHNQDRLALGSEELRVGIGINTGAVGVGLVGGVNRMVLTIIGDAVNLAARIESANKRYGSNLLISDATLSRLENPDQFDLRRMERVMVVNRRRPVTCTRYSTRIRRRCEPRSVPRSRSSTKPFGCSTEARPIRPAPPSNDATNCCRTTRSPPCTWPTAMPWTEVRYAPGRRWRSARSRGS